MDTGCSAAGCSNRARALGLCHRHYMRLYRYGTTDLPAKRPRPSCSIDGCDVEAVCRGWCRRHYNRWRASGTTELRGMKVPHPGRRKPLAERFWPRVDASGDCWQWTGGTTTLGYGTISSGAPENKNLMAHRVAWELLVGPIPDGLHLDHLCRNPGCVNPDHLEPVTPGENTRRGVGYVNAGRRNRAKTHCPAGHPYSPENTYVVRDGRGRSCKTCIFIRTAARRAAKKQGVPYVDPLRVQQDVGI